MAERALDDDAGEVAALRAERDLYRQLLELGSHDELEPFVARALALVVDIAGAKRGYFELRSEGDSGRPEMTIGHAKPAEDAALFRKAISHGVVAEALATGHTVVTTSAHTDQRFRQRKSVRQNLIGAVLCAPIGRGRSLGVIYLQDRHDDGAFSEADRERIEVFARHIEPFVDRLLARHAEPLDPTAQHRRRLKVDRIVGRSKAIAHVLGQACLVAPHKVSVLLTGPTGSGKTQLARLIHDSGPRASKPFVELNCAAIPENLLENELFGSEAGAHSAATTAHDGKVGAAFGGTLFLDEVADLSLAAQSKLLQLLQAGKYYRLGGTAPLDADIRVIAATNKNLDEALAEKNFREDLFYRLNVLPIVLPTLADRSEDIPLLAEHFCRQACRSMGLADIRMSTAALLAAETNEWPGNVRQLSNAVEAATLRAVGEDARQVETHHLFPELEASREEPGLTYEQQLRRFKKTLIERSLEDSNWNVSETARRLDVARSHVNKLIRSLSIRRKPE